jgi:hypothetical protein
MVDPGKELLEACVDAQRRGSDFPTVWRDILSVSRLVIAKPVQRLHPNGAPTLEVRLITGQEIVYGPAGYSLQ